MDAKDIGKNIKRLRKSLGLTQADLANKLGVTYQAVSRWENGKNTPDLQVLLRIKDLFNVTVDEVLLQEKPFEIEYKSKPWYIRYFLFPILLMPFTFLFVQFYFFLYPIYNMITMAILMLIILMIVMIFVKTKHRGRFYLYFTSALYLITLIFYGVFYNFFSINEIPEFKEVQHIDSVFEYQNERPEFLRINNDDYNLAIVYYPNYSDFYIYDFSKPFEEMEQYFSTNNKIVNDVEIVENTIYFTSYEPYDFVFTGTFNIYKFSLDDYVIESVYTDSKPYGIFTDGQTLSLYNIKTQNYQDHSAVYTLLDGELVFERQYSFYITDAKSCETNYIYAVEIPSELHASSNIYSIHNDYSINEKLFYEDIDENIELRQDGFHILTSINGEIVRILDTFVKYTGYMSYDVKRITLIGYNLYLDGGTIRNSRMELVNEKTFYKDNWETEELPILIDSEDENFLIGISEGTIYHIEHFSQQVFSILIPSKLRVILFFISIPFITFITTQGLVEVKGKKDKSIFKKRKLFKK